MSNQILLHEDQLFFEKCLIISAYEALQTTNLFWVNQLTEVYKTDYADKRFNALAYGLHLQQNLAMFLSQKLPEYREEDRVKVIEPDIVHIHDILKSIEVKTTCGSYSRKSNSWKFEHTFKKPVPSKPIIENHILLKVYDPFRYPLEHLKGTYREIAIAKYEHAIFTYEGKRQESYISATDRNVRKKILCKNEVKSNDKVSKEMILEEALKQLLQ